MEDQIIQLFHSLCDHYGVTRIPAAQLRDKLSDTLKVYSKILRGTLQDSAVQLPALLRQASEYA